MDVRQIWGSPPLPFWEKHKLFVGIAEEDTPEESVEENHHHFHIICQTVSHQGPSEDWKSSCGADMSMAPPLANKKFLLHFLEFHY